MLKSLRRHIMMQPPKAEYTKITRTGIGDATIRLAIANFANLRIEVETENWVSGSIIHNYRWKDICIFCGAGDRRTTEYCCMSNNGIPTYYGNIEPDGLHIFTFAGTRFSVTDNISTHSNNIGCYPTTNIRDCGFMTSNGRYGSSSNIGASVLSIRVYGDGVLVNSYTPKKVGSDIGMYDSVSDYFNILPSSYFSIE